jgi:phosphate transport system substrate-binding protein
MRKSLAGRETLYKFCTRRYRHAICWLLFSPVLWAQSVGQAHLVIVGSTLPLPAYSRLIEEFEKTHAGIHTSYLPFGSSQGMEMVAAGKADFGASDAPVANRPLGRKILFFPVFVVALVPIYNLPGVTAPLRFTPNALAGIYLGKIKKWNDPEIARSNPEANLPSNDIVVIHSMAGRGSTYIWSDYLSKVSPEWKTRVGRGIAVRWPVGSGAEGNGNVAQTVKDTPNAISYVGLQYALQRGLRYGRVQNTAGKFVNADAVSVKAAVSAAAAKATPADFRYSITNPAGEASYPIASFTWLVVSEDMLSADTQHDASVFLRWVLDEGQTNAQAAGFVPLPKELVENEFRAIEQISPLHR